MYTQQNSCRFKITAGHHNTNNYFYFYLLVCACYQKLFLDREKILFVEYVDLFIVVYF